MEVPLARSEDLYMLERCVNASLAGYAIDFLLFRDAYRDGGKGKQEQAEHGTIARAINDPQHISAGISP